MGSSVSPQTQLYGSTPVDQQSPATATTGSSFSQSSPGLMFGAPGDGLSAQGTPAPGGKSGAFGNNPQANNQAPTGVQAAQTTNFDPSLSMNSVYAQNPYQGTTSMMASPVPQPYTNYYQNSTPYSAPVAQDSTLSSFLNSGSNISALSSYLGSSANSPFLSAASNGGKAVA